MLKNTAGPWEVMPESWAAGHVDISSKTRGALAVVVVKMEGAEKNDPEGEANARLIGAAPDLLAALEEARTGLHWYHDTYPQAVTGCDYEAMERIDAAILLATGSAS